MRVLVAGATGDVGLPAVRALLEAGHQVVALSRGRRAAAVAALGVRGVTADALDGPAVEAAVAEAAPEAVVDLLTALPRAGPTRPSHLRATNALRRRGTANLHRAVVAAGARRYVAESVTFVYGYGGRDRLLTEDDPVGPGPETPPSYVPALQAAAAKERLVAGGPLDGVVLRFGLFYGPGAGSTSFMETMLRRRMLALPGGGRGVVPWIHVADAGRAVAAAIERGHPGEMYNVVDDEAVSFREFTGELARRVGAPPPYGIPAWVARPFVPYAAMFMSESRLRVSNEKAKRGLGWSPRFPSFREGLATLERAD